MGDNTFGNKLKITSFGESHGKMVGVVIDGFPAGFKFDLTFIQGELEKRKPGQSNFTTARKEHDKVEVLSGIFKERTTGAPICLMIRNIDIDSKFYEESKNLLRPSHIDYVIREKYGDFADYRGSGRFSGRITAGFVMAGALAKQILSKYKVSILAYTRSIGVVEDLYDYSVDNLEDLSKKKEMSPIGALDLDISKKMETEIKTAKRSNDSVGGTICCIVNNVPPGIGGPIFNSLESNISRGIFSIPAVKGIEFGAGFKASKMRGSEHNDPWTIENGRIRATKNDSGGIIGGISTGMPIIFTIAVKPTSSIGKTQKTVNIMTKQVEDIRIEGRHDPCIVPRVNVVVESIAAIVILDFLLIEGRIPCVLED